MENKASSSFRSKINHPTIISALFFSLCHLIFLTIMAWVALEAWFIVRLIIFHCIDVSGTIQKIMNDDLLVISQYRLHGSEAIFNIADHVFLILKKYSENNVIDVIFNVTKIIWIRWIIFIHFIPLMIITFYIAVIDGLVLRDKRKFQCARESTFLFHRLKKLTAFSFFTSFFIYMVYPYSVTPSAFLVPMIALASLFITNTIKNFKKYL